MADALRPARGRAEHRAGREAGRNGNAAGRCKDISKVTILKNVIAQHVVIIGGGTTGIAAFTGIIEHRSARRVDLVDPGTAGFGKTFANTRLELLCNTPAESMSVLAHEPDDFLAYLRALDIPASRHDCVPRAYVSRYAMQRYREYCRIAEQKDIQHTHFPARAQAIVRQPDGHYRVNLSDGNAIAASHVIVCHGYGEPVVAAPLHGLLGSPGLFTSPYPEQALLDKLAPRSKVLVVGSKLSAIDSAVLLCSHGHRVVMVSPSGDIPAVRTRAPDLSSVLQPGLNRIDFAAGSFRFALLRAIERGLRQIGAPTLRPQVSRARTTIDRLREEIALAEQDRIAWQDLLLAFLKQGNDILAAEGHGIPFEHFRNCMRMTTRYLSAVPASNAKKLLKFLEEGSLQIRKAGLQHVRRGADWEVALDDGMPVEHYDAIVCASGYKKPPLDVTGDALLVDPEPGREWTEPKVSPDLRVCLPGASLPERIWLLGVTSYKRAPLVNGVYQATKQAEFIRSQLVAAQ
jgi:uncharacterized NAD(P)/FAD-binding protein YdhS